MERPDACNGCPACPGSPGYDPKKTGAFVPPKGDNISYGDPKAISWRDFVGIKLVVVGMSPSFREVDEGEPFVGPSLVEWRRGLGPFIDTIQIFKTNYMNCRAWKPGKTVDYINRDPKADEAKACSVRWLVPILRAMAEAERHHHQNIMLHVFGQKAFDVVFQGKYGTFGGSKGSRGQRMNRRKESYDVLADRIERWATKATRKKERYCKDCNVPLTVPRVRLCPDCKKGKEKCSEKKSKSPTMTPTPNKD